MTEIKKNSKSEKPVMIPIGLPDLDNEFADTKFIPDRVRAILGYATLQWIRYRNEQKFALGTKNYSKNSIPVVELSSEHIRRIVGRHSAKYMLMLSNSGWLLPIKKEGKERGSYWKGSQFIKYKLSLDILKKPGADKRKFRKEYITDQKTLNQIEKARVYSNNLLNKSRTINANDKVAQQIWRYADTVRLDTSQIELAHQQKLIGKQASDELFVIADAINNSEFKIYKVDEFGHRIHSVVTNLDKKVRPFLYYDAHPDAPLVVLDIKNSQPYLCSLILKDPELCIRFTPEFEPLLKVIRGFKAADTNLFHYHCANGEVYEQWLISQNKVKGSVVSKEKRDEVKDAFMAFLFSAPDREGFGKSKWAIKNKEQLDNAFRMTYMEVYALVTAIKTVPQELLPFMDKHYQNKREEHKRVKKHQHKSYAYLNMPAMMQRLESACLRKISKRMIDDGIGPFTTVHDSWILLEGDVDKAEQIVKEFFAELGFRPPQIKREACNKISNP